MADPAANPAVNPMADPMADPSSIRFPIDDGLVYYARVYAGVVGSLLAISSTLVGIRVFTRFKSATAGLNIEDWLLVLAAALAAVDFASIIAANTPALSGSSFVYLSNILSVGAPLSVVSAVMSALSVPLIKISVAIMLLRLLQSKFWKRFLSAIIAIQVVMAVFVTIMQTTRCIPLNGLWDPTITDKKCWSFQAFRDTFSFTSAVTILTDIILSLMPSTFILHIRRPLRERLVILFLMGLGIFASAASITKTVIIQSYNDSGDTGLRIALWAAVEEQVGIIAACLPCLKSLFHRGLQRLGLVSTTAPIRTGYGQSGTNPAISVRTHIETVRSKAGAHHEDSVGSDEEGLVDLGLAHGSVQMKCMKA